MNQFTEAVGIQYPIIGGPMYPCSNPELVAAISQAGALGVIQPLSLTYVHGYDFRQGVQYIQSLTDKSLGFNALIEKTSKKYHERMSGWIDIALEQGIRFFITSLGKPDWVVKKVHKFGGLVYHDVTEKKWAQIGIDCGVDGLIAVNNRAGGHCGSLTAEQLFEECQPFGKPMVCAGGIASHEQYQSMLDLGYQACQLGTRFIASAECRVSDSYKQAIIKASEADIVLTEKMTGVPVSIIKPRDKNNDQLKTKGLVALMLKTKRFKHLARIYLNLKSLVGLKKAITSNAEQSNYWQAGKSVQEIDQVFSAEQIIKSLVQGTNN